MAYAFMDPAERSPWRRAVGVAWVAVWLVFLGSPLARIWHHDDGFARVVGTAAVLAFAATYLTLFVTARMAWRARCGQPGPRPRLVFLLLAGLGALVLAALPFAAETTLTMLVYLAAASMFTFEPWLGVVVVTALAAVAEISSRMIAGWQSQQWSASFAILFAGVAVYATRLASRRNLDLIAAREEMADMAVAEERSRMTRDLHDILGHSLTVITVKAELAGRLMTANEAKAHAEIEDIERLAREALSDVRATIAGRREVSLAPELVNARAALASANIDAEVPNALDDVPAVNRELFGWTVREGVTNVLRHSHATRCSIRLSGSAVEVHDNGVGVTPVSADGSGLRGLRERVVGCGASIHTGVSPDLGGFLLHVSAPKTPVDA
jgi:two-component system, NarL family, sensor histidine kinase DesK